MRKTTSALLGLCALAALGGRADDPDPEPPGGGQAELKKLKGTWTVTKILAGNREVKLSSTTTFTFDGDKLTRTTSLAKAKKKAERSLKYKVKLDTKKQPHRIELVPDNGKNSQVGIYKIEKGQLHFAPGRPTGKNGNISYVVPRDFKGEQGPVYVMTREKGGK
jgi:uncharacterized protein (TIGR03067 family)